MNQNLFALSVIGGILIRAVIIGANVTAENIGAEISFINGAKMRDVHFPHHRHQTAQARQGLLLYSDIPIVNQVVAAVTITFAAAISLKQTFSFPPPITDVNRIGNFHCHNSSHPAIPFNPNHQNFNKY